MNWYIGQDIVAIRSHPQGVFKENDVFSIKALRTAMCGCHEREICIGYLIPNGYAPNITLCSGCKCSYKDPSTTWFFSEDFFAPLDTLVNIDELKEVLNEPAFQ